MIDFINKTISKVFGNKSERDIKELVPFVASIKEAEKNISQLNDDQLRGKTIEFRNKISEYTKDTLKEIEDINANIDSDPQMDLVEKEDLYRRLMN